jgi:fibronectin-binding autotransporter adhesin
MMRPMISKPRPELAAADLATGAKVIRPVGGKLAAACAIAILWLAASAACADSFDWTNVGGQSFLTPVKDQGSAGTCWAFSSVGTLEAKYLITRNDTSFQPDLSEQNVICPGTMGDAVNGGWEDSALDYFTSTGIVAEAELPYTAQNTSPYWPLQADWRNRVWKSVSNQKQLTADTASIKAALNLYGPLAVAICHGDLNTTTLGTDYADHAVVLVGYVDTTGGGYWIVKNSWGPSWNGNGYGTVMYGNIERQDDVSAITGAVYYTGAMGTAAWQGGSGTWSAGTSSHWTMSGSAYAWQNTEIIAVFNTAGSANLITISGTAIAHGLVFNSGAADYTFSGGAMTVTAGGITAGESVTINSPFTVGGPQTWSVAAGKTLTLGSSVHTVISTLTIAGQGDTTILGPVDGGGAINSRGAPAGDLLLASAGTLSLAGSSGAIQQAASLSLLSGRLLLDNSLENNASRIAAAIPLSLQGGELALGGNAAGTTAALGDITLGTGTFSTITMIADSQPAIIAPLSLARGAAAAALVRGGNLGAGGSGAVGRLQLPAPLALSNSGSGDEIGIVPYLVGDASPTGSGSGLVTYDTCGVRLLADSEYSATLAANKNVRLGTSQALGGSLSAGSLVLTNTGDACQVTVGTGSRLTITSGALLSTGSAGNLIQGGSLSFGANAVTAYEGIITTAADLTIQSSVTNTGGHPVALSKGGSGTLVLSGSNSFSGGTVVSDGAIQVMGSGALGSGPLTIAGHGAIAGDIAVGTSLVLNRNGYTYGGVISGTGSLVIQSTGTTTLSGSNAFTGATSLGSGTLAIANPLALQFSTLNVAANKGGVAFGTLTAVTLGGLAGDTSGSAGGGDIALQNSLGQAVMLTIGNNNANTTFIGGLTGSGGVVKVGSGKLTFNGFPGLAAHNNTYTGGTTLCAGTLQVNSDDRQQPLGYFGDLADPSCPVIFAGSATLQFGTLDIQAGYLPDLTQFSPLRTFQLGTGVTGTFDTQAAQVTIPGVIGGGGNLLKSGSGTLILAGTNAYGGATTVNGGTLALGNPAALQQSTFDASGSGTLSFGTLTAALFGGLEGSGRLALVDADSAGVALSVGNNGLSTIFSGALGGSGSLTKIGSGTLVLSGSDNYTGGTTVLGGVLDIESIWALPSNTTLVLGNSAELVFATDLGSAIQLSLMLPGAGGGEAGMTYFHVTTRVPASVPEPGTIVLLAAAALVVVARLCRLARRD